MTERPFAEVIGDPIAHSKSPLIHGFWLDRLGISGTYGATRVKPEELAGYFSDRRSDPHWRGCNVTVPHKEAVIAHLDRLTPLAEEVGAVNTITREGAELVGDNTDVLGIVDALPSALFGSGPPKRACLIGSGGAALGALAAFRRLGLERVDVNVRNAAKGQALLARLEDGSIAAGHVGAVDDQANVEGADLIVNASILGMNGKDSMPLSLLQRLAGARRDAVVFDMVYHPLETELLRSARALGLPTVDGLRMLVGQAAAAFEKFFGHPAPREADDELRAMLTS